MNELPGPERRAARLAGAAPVRWEDLSWPELAALRDGGPGLVVLPIGATEQHGPHLPVGCDNVIGSAVCAYASAKTGVPVLPFLNYGVSVGHLPDPPTRWPGTLSVVHETLMRAVREMVGWLFDSGWRRVLLINSHFGNDATLRCAVDRLRTDRLGQLQIGLINTFKVSEAVWEYFIQDADDLHANRAETELMLYLTPHLVDLAACAAADDPDRTAGKVFSYPVTQTSTNGVTGRPSEATAEAGEKLLAEMGDALAELFEKAKAETPPFATT